MSTSSVRFLIRIHFLAGLVALVSTFVNVGCGTESVSVEPLAILKLKLVGVPALVELSVLGSRLSTGGTLTCTALTSGTIDVSDSSIDRIKGTLLTISGTASTSAEIGHLSKQDAALVFGAAFDSANQELGMGCISGVQIKEGKKNTVDLVIEIQP